MPTMKNAMIVAPQPEAVEAGAEVLERGGNAIDAAIACAFMLRTIGACHRPPSRDCREARQ